MFHFTLAHLLLLTLAAVVAGIVDTLAGGGGLITVPALLLSGVPPILALGTNKLQSCLCETSATVIFRKKMGIQLSSLKTGLAFTLAGSVLGTLLLQVTHVELLKKLVPVFLLAVFLMNLFSKSKTTIEENMPSDPKLVSRLIPLGLCIGFYNGFFGPGTGTIWAVALRRFLRLTLKKATMMTKPLNLIGNLTALAIFFASGQINLWAGVAMGFGAVAGGIIGANLVILKDARWLKIIFNVLMGASVLGAFFAG
jgi:uncharacterized membrane protein YfcA